MEDVEMSFMAMTDILMISSIILSVEDLERNDGSPDRPFYMSRGLQRLLRKGNKEAWVSAANLPPWSSPLEFSVSLRTLPAISPSLQPGFLQFKQHFDTWILCDVPSTHRSE